MIRALSLICRTNIYERTLFEIWEVVVCRVMQMKAVWPYVGDLLSTAGVTNRLHASFVRRYVYLPRSVVSLFDHFVVHFDKDEIYRIDAPSEE